MTSVISAMISALASRVHRAPPPRPAAWPSSVRALGGPSSRGLHECATQRLRARVQAVWTRPARGRAVQSGALIFHAPERDSRTPRPTRTAAPILSWKFASGNLDQGLKRLKGLKSMATSCARAPPSPPCLRLTSKPSGRPCGQVPEDTRTKLEKSCSDERRTAVRCTAAQSSELPTCRPMTLLITLGKWWQPRWVVRLQLLPARDPC